MTKDLLTEGSRMYSGLDFQTSGFTGLVGMDSGIGRSKGSEKEIKSTDYAEAAEKKLKKVDINKNRARFAGFMGERY